MCRLFLGEVRVGFRFADHEWGAIIVPTCFSFAWPWVNIICSPRFRAVSRAVFKVVPRLRSWEGPRRHLSAHFGFWRKGGLC